MWKSNCFYHSNLSNTNIMAKPVADQLVEMLGAAGIKRIYAVTGDSLNHINDAVRRDGRIQWIHVRHEEVGAYAAGAEAQLNELACCAGSSGPGHAVKNVYGECTSMVSSPHKILFRTDTRWRC